MPTLTCPECRAALRLPDSAAGRTGRCPKCQTRITVPPADAEPAAEPAPVAVVDDPPADAEPAAEPARSGERRRLKAEADEPSDRPAKAKGKDKKAGAKHKPAAAGDRTRVAVLAGAGLTLALLLAVGGVVVWLLTRGPATADFTPDGPAPAGPGADSQPAAAADQQSAAGPAWPVAVGPARPAKDGLVAGPLAVKAVPPTDWKVTPDPLPAGEPLGSAFALPKPLRDPQLVLGAPGSGRAAVVGRGTKKDVHLVRFDLRKSPFPVGAAEFQDPPTGTPGAHALSPDGDRLAVLYLARDTIRVWGPDGKLETTLKMPKGGQPFVWVGFPAPDRVIALSDAGNVVEYELPSGKVVADRPLGVKLPRLAINPHGIKSPVVLSPGRNFAAVVTDGGFAWFKLPGWEPAGTLRLPDGLPPDLPPPTAAISPDGTAFAAHFGLPNRIDKTGSHTILTWNLADGALKDALRLPVVRFYTFPVRPTVYPRWAGPRHLWLGGCYLIDLDRGEQVWTITGSLPESPDGRIWQVPDLQPAEAKQLWAKLTAGKEAPFPETAAFLTAGTTPVEALKARSAGVVQFGRGRPVRAEVSSAAAAAMPRLTDTFAVVLTENGFTVDPAAPTAIRLTFKPAEVHIAGVMTGVTRTTVMRGDSKQASVQCAALVQFVGPDGKVLWTGDGGLAAMLGTQNLGGPGTAADVTAKHPEATLVDGTVGRKPVGAGVDGQYPVEVGKAQEMAARKLFRNLNQLFPDRHLADALGFGPDGKPVRLPPVGALGIDGFTEARVEEMKKPN